MRKILPQKEIKGEAKSRIGLDRSVMRIYEHDFTRVLSRYKQICYRNELYETDVSLVNFDF